MYIDKLTALYTRVYNEVFKVPPITTRNKNAATEAIAETGFHTEEEFDVDTAELQQVGRSSSETVSEFVNEQELGRLLRSKSAPRPTLSFEKDEDEEE